MKNALAVVGLLLLVVLVGRANAADVRPHDSTYPLQRAFGEVDRTSGWCDAATTTPTNIWDSANVPAELSTTSAGLENRRAVRFITLTHVDGTNTTVPLCMRLGPNTGSTPTRSALTCTGTAGSEATNGSLLYARGGSRSFITAEIAAGSSPSLYVRASTGSVRYCVEVAFKS